MKIKSMRSLYIIVIGFGAVLIAIVAFAAFWWEILRITTPECQEHVKVVKKRIEDTEYYHAGTDGYSKVRDYFATFEFPDGAKKEFNIGGSYKTIYIGDTGMLTYHESKFIDIYREETDRWRGRLIISFEKDPEFGGTKKILHKFSNEVESFLIGAGVIVLGISVILICLKLML